MAYLTKDQYAQKQKYADWDAFALVEDYPSEAAIDDMIEEMTELMNDEIGTNGTDVTTAKYLTMLRNICYRGVQMMIDEELARAHQERRMVTMPADYMYARDRQRLRSIGMKSGLRKRGVWVF